MALVSAMITSAMCNIADKRERERERETAQISWVDMNEGRFTLITSVRSYVNLGHV